MQLYSYWALILLFILPALAYWMIYKRPPASIKFSSLAEMKVCPVSWRARFRPLLKAARLICLGLLIISLARPRKGTVLSEISTEGVAINVVVDRSGSMSTEMTYEGQNLNRLEVVKKVFYDFIKGDGGKMTERGGDLVGLITFARYADTICPLVQSHNVLLEFLKTTDIVKLRSEDGTAIGDAVALAAARLKKAEEEISKRSIRLGLDNRKDSDNKEKSNFKIKSKVIILLTDGRNNTGQYDPLQAAELAKNWSIKIYTIGIGSAQAYTTIQTPMGSFKVPTQQNLDENLLKMIAEKTQGFYGRATDSDTLIEIVKKIDELEKSNVKSVQYTQFTERFGPWTFSALLVLVLEILAGCTVFRKIP